MESQFLENTKIKITCHDADKCAGEYCTIHNRSEHVMRSFPQMWRGDRGFMERICPHGVGHPDPDEVYLHNKWDWSHACDGCCLGENTSVENTIIDDTIIDDTIMNDSKYKRSPIGTIYNHEPECIPVVTKLYSANDTCPFCTAIRSAYQRGREDAANALRNALTDYLYGQEFGAPEHRLISTTRGGDSK